MKKKTTDISISDVIKKTVKAKTEKLESNLVLVMAAGWTEKLEKL